MSGGYVWDSDFYAVMLEAVGLDDDPIEEIQDEEATKNQKDTEVSLPIRPIIMRWHLLIPRLNALLHDPKPSLSHRHLEHSYYGLTYIIKIRVASHPVAPIVHAGLHIDNKLLKRERIWAISQ